MDRKIFVTADGSYSVMDNDTNLTFHSRHGALQESMHIFIRAGLLPLLNNNSTMIRVFEMGFGTGLNALLTLAESDKYSVKVSYHAIDLFLLPESITSGLNYCQSPEMAKWESSFQMMHSAKIGEKISLSPNFIFLKSNMDISLFDTEDKFDLVYYDAFGPDDQPEVWTASIFQKVQSWLVTGAILVTYSAKGQVRRSLEQSGFRTKKLPGPPGKREFIVAEK